jgi:hypothetical protein
MKKEYISVEAMHFIKYTLKNIKTCNFKQLQLVTAYLDESKESKSKKIEDVRKILKEAE